MADIDEEELIQLQGLVEDESSNEVQCSFDFIFSDLEEEMEADNISEEQMPQTEKAGNKKKLLSNMQKTCIVQKLLFAADANDTLPKGIISEMATQYHCSRQTISKLWKDAKLQKMSGNVINVNNKMQGRVGRKCKELSEEVLQSVPLHKRTTIRSYAKSLQVSPSLVYSLLKRGTIRTHSNSIKPKLSNSRKEQRIVWILKHIIPRTMSTKAIFEGFFNYVHIDEKWFYLNSKTKKFYLLPKEEDPYRSTQNKNYILKVMFLAAVARPVIDEACEVIWDGKIGIFPFTEVVVAQTRSSNRERGTAEIKAIQKVTREVIKQKLINDVIPTIRAKWPADASRHILIQQDNARPHIVPNDTEFNEAAQVDGFDFKIVNQPPQSPDLNVLDLDFFRAIQSLQHHAHPRNVEELVSAVKDAYQAFDPKVLNYTWLHLQYVMLEILKHKGHNNYKDPHRGKGRLERLGILPTSVEVEQSVIDDAVQFLNEGTIVLNEGDDT